MKKIFLVLMTLLLAGCTQEMTCEQYCPTQPHIQCVGEWNITGTYPDCTCGYVCSVSDLGDLEDLSISVGGLEDLGDLPDVNQTIDIGGGLLSSNPFPSEPNLG